MDLKTIARNKYKKRDFYTDLFIYDNPLSGFTILKMCDSNQGKFTKLYKT